MCDADQPTVSHSHDDEKADETEPDVHFEPVIKLEKVEIKDSEADETPIFKMRAKLFRFDKAATEWKERGTGEMKLLMHKTTGKVRVLMRRDKTLKLCANHYITPEMKLNPNVGSDRSWVWTALADYSEEEVKPEMLAARFANSDIAQRFKAKFEEAQKWNQELTSGSATPNSIDAPKPDPDAVEVLPEEGSDKKKKDEEVAAAVAATAATTVTQVERKIDESSHAHGSETLEPKVLDSSPVVTNTETENKPEEPKPAADVVVEAPASAPVSEEMPSKPVTSETEPNVVEEEDKAHEEPASTTAVEGITHALASQTIDAKEVDAAPEQDDNPAS